MERASGGPSGSYIVPAGIHKIKHVIIVMQENRSFAGSTSRFLANAWKCQDVARHDASGLEQYLS